MAGALAFMFVAPLPWYTACTTIVNKWIPEEDVDVIPSPSGGVYLNNETDYWHVSRSDLDSANGNVEFYILNTPNPTCLDSDCVLPECIGMEEMDKTLDYSREFKNKLKPKFIWDYWRHVDKIHGSSKRKTTDEALYKVGELLEKEYERNNLW